MSTDTQGAPAPISPESIQVVTYKGIPVLTTEMLAQLYGTNDQNVRKNFNENAARFIEGTHYVKLEGHQLREFKNYITQSDVVSIPNRTRHLILWTERGAARHAKMLDTEQAWEIFERLEDSYFRQKETAAQALPAPAPVDELPEEVRAAIARKAHALAMEGFEQIRARLEQRAREQLPYSSPKEFLLWLDDIGGSDAELIVLSAHELWDITSMVAVAHRGIGNALEAIHNLEAKTGRWWHGRPDAD